MDGAVQKGRDSAGNVSEKKNVRVGTTILQSRPDLRGRVAYWPVAGMGKGSKRARNSPYGLAPKLVVLAVEPWSPSTADQAGG